MESPDHPDGVSPTHPDGVVPIHPDGVVQKDRPLRIN
jgi:hypothetical protein